MNHDSIYKFNSKIFCYFSLSKKIVEKRILRRNKRWAIKRNLFENVQHAYQINQSAQTEFPY